MRILPLSEIDPQSLTLVGGKALQLGSLVRAGLPVPGGFCITTEAFRQGMDEALAGEIASAYQALGAGPVAVRSSATAEDLAEASFAGQQDTFLNVTGAEEVVKAVQACWRSMHTERAVAYRRDQGIPEENVAMGVVVQRMVPAEAAGVLFTLNPVTGALDELVVEAALGLGDQVVSARVNPDRYRLRRRGPHEVIEAQGRETAALLDAARLAEIARLGLAAERLLGRAADIEWALAGGRVFLLQNRAVTAAGPRLPVIHYGSRWNEEHCRGRLTVWANHNVRETMPYPHTPFSWSFWNYLVFPQAAAAMGVYSTEDLAALDQVPSIMDLVDGRVYWNLNVQAGFYGILLRPMLHVGHLLDAEVTAIVRDLHRTGQLHPLGRPFRLRRLWRAWRAPGGLRVVLGRSSPEKAWEELRKVQEEVESFGKIDLTILSEGQILALARYFASQTVPRGLSPLAASLPALPALALLSRWLPRWGFAGQLPSLLSGLRGNPTMDTALALWDLAESAGPEVRATFAVRPIAEVPAVLRETPAGREFLEGLDRFLKEHGHRAVREFDFSCPRWREDPTFLYETMRNYLAHPADQPTPRQHYEHQVRAHQEAKTAVEQGLGRRPLRRWLFRRLMRTVETRLHLREAPKFYALMGMAHLRDLYLEVGRRFVARGVLAVQEDFFFLTIPEIERVAAGQLDVEWLREEIPRRRLEFARNMRANPPLVVRSDGQPVIHALAATGPVLRGTPASAGLVRGPARILMDPGDGALLHKGEILVAPFTDPGWTPLFLTAGGLVMEIGGMMSHGAVVAREYGLPAVVGVKDATRLLRDGEVIEVDGATGEVRRV